MGKSSGKAPPAPDYTALAIQQANLNNQAAQTTAKMQNQNIVTPFGGQTVQYGGFNDAAYQQAIANWEKNKDWYASQGLESPRPEISQFVSDANTPTVTQYLTPEAQKTVEAQQKVDLALANLGQQGIGQAQNILSTPFQYKGPAIQTNLGDTGTVAKTFGGTSPIQMSADLSNIDLEKYGQTRSDINRGNIQNRIDVSGLAAMPISAGTTAQEALLSRLGPQLQREQAAQRQVLANQGITSGSEAYRNAQTEMGQRYNDLVTQAALQGINLDMAARQQGLNEQLGLGNFANTAQQQDYLQQMGVQGLYNQALAQNQNAALQQAQFNNAAALQNAQFANQAQQQAYNQAAQRAAFQNAAQQQAYGQALQSAQFGNTAANQALQQQLALRNQPLNEITGLMGASQVTVPQFQGYSGATQQAPNLLGAAQNQYGAAMDQYNAQVNSANAANQGLFGLGSSLIGAGAFLSDRRLKSNIVRVGTHPLGIGVYEYDIGGQHQRGVMADEVEQVRPDAVITRPDGYKMVNYGMLQ